MEVIGKVQRGEFDLEIELVATRCSACGKWTPEDDSEPVRLVMPDPEATYYDAAVLEELPEMETLGCSCGEDEGTAAPIPDFAAELLPDASLAMETVGVLRGETAAKWFLYQGKPPHLHTLTWRRLATTTRAQHLRWLRVLKGMPHAWHGASLGVAAVQAVLVQREQHGWTSWATVASALSAVASALRHLPEYSTSRVSIDLMKDDVAFASAARRAQQLARVTKRFALAAAMTHAGYEAIIIARVAYYCDVFSPFMVY